MPVNYANLEATARPGAFSMFDMQVLVPELQELEEGQVYLEVGVDKGRSLEVARRTAHPAVDINGVDIRPDPEVAGTHFYQLDSHVPESAEKVNKKIDVLFIDGDHTYEGCKADIDVWSKWVVPGGVMLFHDADETSPGVVQAIEEYCKENNKEAWFDPNVQCGMARIVL